MAGRSGALTIAGGNVIGDSPRPEATSPQPSAPKKSAKPCAKIVAPEATAHDKVLEWREDQKKRKSTKHQTEHRDAEQKIFTELQKQKTGHHMPEASEPIESSESKEGTEGQGTLQYSGSCQKTRMKGLPGSHWTENPMAMEMMKEMSFTYSVPALQPRLTAFHGTRVPVLILFSLLSTEVGRLAVLDTFWKRIVRHPMVWQGIYCRDYDSPRCVWRTLNGQVGSDKCLCHLGNTNPPLFNKFCKQISSIPGRSPEELLETYRLWRQKLVNKGENKGDDAKAELLFQTAESLATALPQGYTATPAEPQQDWSVRAHASYGLSPGHGLRIQYSDQFEDPKAVIEASAWCRAIEKDPKHLQRIGGPPKRSILKPKASPRPPASARR